MGHPSCMGHQPPGRARQCASKDLWVGGCATREETADPSTALLAMKPARSFAQNDTSMGNVDRRGSSFEAVHLNGDAVAVRG